MIISNSSVEKMSLYLLFPNKAQRRSPVKQISEASSNLNQVSPIKMTAKTKVKISKRRSSFNFLVRSTKIENISMKNLRLCRKEFNIKKMFMNREKEKRAKV
jgi:hypothetical protein